MMNKRDGFQQENIEEVLTRQLPEYFRPVREFQEIIRAHGGALEQLKKNVLHLWDNFYLSSCDGPTLSYYEILLGITKNKGLTLEERRLIVLIQYSARSLYTLPVLKEMLASAVGDKGYLVNCLYDEYKMIVRIIGQDMPMVRELYTMVAMMRPAHIALSFYAEYREEAKVEVKSAVAITFTTSFYPRYNLPKLLLDGTWSLDGSLELNGYDGGERIDFYPVGVKFVTQVLAGSKENSQLHFLIHTEEMVNSLERMAIKASAKCNITSAEEVSFTAKAVGTPGEETKVSFALGSAKEQIESRQKITVQVSAECREGTTKSMAMQVAVEVSAGAGEVIVENRNMLDGTWLLDGSRKLNGGIYQL